MYASNWNTGLDRSRLWEWWWWQRSAAWLKPDWRPDWFGPWGHHRVNTWTWWQHDNIVYLWVTTCPTMFTCHNATYLFQHQFVSAVLTRLQPCALFTKMRVSHSKICQKGSLFIWTVKNLRYVWEFKGWPSSVCPWLCSNWMGWPFFTVILKCPMSLGVGTN